MNIDEQKHREIAIKEFPKFTEMLESILNLKRWGFQKTLSGTSTRFPPSIIYDSQWCRVRFLWPVPDIRDREASIHILYGRLHAPNDAEMILWNGEQCFCWHDIDLVLHFLDGRSPEDVAYKDYDLPGVMKKFYDSKDRRWSQREWLVRMHEKVWEHYGIRFFEFFDLHRPDLWSRYIRFVKEFRRLKESGSKTQYGGPWPSNIC